MNINEIILRYPTDPNAEYQNLLVRITDYSTRTTKSQKPYKSFTISDNSGHLSMKMWDPTPLTCQNEELIDLFGVAIVNFTVSSYNRDLQGTVKFIQGLDRTTIPPHLLAELVPYAPEPFEFYYGNIMQNASRLSNNYWREIVVRLLTNFKNDL